MPAMPPMFETSAIVRRFRESNRKSAEHEQRARKVVPGGTSRATMLQKPFPVYLADARGASVWDLDGNERLDFNNNMLAMIHGHGHPEVVAAVKAQLERTSAFTSVSEREAELAETLCGRVASIDKVTFDNSGTEAVMMAIRLARAYTGRTRILRFEGGYHGFYDPVITGSFSNPPVDAPHDPHPPVRDMAGMPPGVTEDAVLVPYNDAEAVRRVFREQGERLAAVIVEPMLGGGGMIPGLPDFLRTIREESAKTGTVMICDEVITLRFATGGAQEVYGLAPDLTTMGKIIGGGYPVGAVGGRAEIMDLCRPADEGGAVMTMGTFNSNPVTVTAGLATLKLLDKAAIDRLNGLGDRLRKGLSDCIEKRQVPARVTGAASCFDIHFTRREINNARDVATDDEALQQVCSLGLANRGILVSKSRKGGLSTVMDEGIIDRAVEAFDDTLTEMTAEGWFDSARH
ncbi:aspartate aminotransferase family protein [Marinibaculum pumilum]|uniref:Aspartate aminotransferase family protein n=1 Tax=Marinibaculum pumilum TaxID=1766165 RepID=A0ABV7KTP0_9PROT